MASAGFPQTGTGFGRHRAGLRLAGLWPVAVLAPLLVACQGSVGEPGSSGDGTTTIGPGGGVGMGGGGRQSLPPGTDPGRVTIHRLNRAEYNNSVSDLVGTRLTPADDFPADNRAIGFDNIADSLTLSDTQMQLYQDAAESISEVALGAQRAHVVPCDPAAMGDACARTVVETFGKRAWRRPLSSDEVNGILGVAATANQQQDTPDAAIKLAVQAILLSPNFLFRVELDPSPTSLSPHPINDYELASRLSYFLWSTMPDDALFAAADAGTLHNKDVLAAQIIRMLKDPKAEALVDNFSGQWLFSRQIVDAPVDATTFPMFDAPLRDAMLEETKLLFRDVAFAGLGADAILTANFTYLNDRLAAHYGMAAIGSTDLKRVDLSDDKRGGLLAQGSFLTVTSHPTMTSPVNRGKAILTQLLCSDVPDPPKGVNTQLPTSMTGTTRRQQLESHRNNPTCASCHALMDPLGFGLENYDAVGAYRATDNGAAVDASGTYPGGQMFSGAHQLAQLVAHDARFPSCMTQQLLKYALGRDTSNDGSSMDPATIARVTQEFAAGGMKFEGLVQKLVASDTFLKRRGEAPVAGGSP